MSGFDSNPFADPVDGNPFQVSAYFDHFNSLSSCWKLKQYGAPKPASVSAAAASLAKQQEELEKKAAELDRKERELESRGAVLKENNWPPLPKFFPVKPCFYQDFEEDIPDEYRRICRRMYYLWMFHSATLFLNLLGCLAYFTAASTHAAFRSDSSFNFFSFFFVFFIQVVVYIIQTVGIPGWGNSGWIAAISMISSNLPVAVTMLVVAGFFTVNAVLGVILLKMVHSKYRRTGASFTKAQQEFSQNVMTNRTVQTAATNAAQGAFGVN
uniref:Secretory carrier-associated membrane protein n=1 Tax=Neogobius melanostomus TaxID=47308 RepID=A0A8C6UB95_9GOBI